MPAEEWALPARALIDVWLLPPLLAAAAEQELAAVVPGIAVAAEAAVVAVSEAAVAVVYLLVGIYVAHAAAETAPQA